eukprot:2948524-Pleurochrysis_carterae.AAC.1
MADASVSKDSHSNHPARRQVRSGGLNDAQDHAQEVYSDHGEDDNPQEDSDGVVEDYTGTLEDDAEDADEY